MHLRPVTMVLLVTLSVACVQPDDTVTFTRVVDGPIVTNRASTGGVSWIDYDEDGDLDLYATNGFDVSMENAPAQANRLYRNDGDGMFTSLADHALVRDSGYSSGSTWGDYDNDGHLDVFVSNEGEQGNFLYRGLGDGAFERVLDENINTDGGRSYSASWVDMDNDGNLDLYVANGGLSQPGPDFLYRNNGDGTFTRVTEGPLATDTTGSGGGVWGDYDGDGDADLFLPTQVGTNVLYRNDGRFQFAKLTGDPPATDALAGSLAAAWGDYDNDGDLDLYVTHMYGMRNHLYRNDGGSFVSVAAGDATLDGGHTYACNWADADNDGDLDLVVANWGAAPVLYENDGAGLLSRMPASGVGSEVGHASSVAWGDYDGDGDVDLLVGNWPNSPGPEEENFLYRNDGPVGNWIRLHLIGTHSNRAAIGARVFVRTGNRTQLHEVTAHTGWRSQNPLDVLVGLGTATQVDEILVHWPGGTQDTLADVSGGRAHTITEAGG